MPEWLVTPMQITLLNHIKYTFVFFLFSIYKTTFFNSLKIMKKSLITEYSDISVKKQDELLQNLIRIEGVSSTATWMLKYLGRGRNGQGVTD